MHDPTDRGDLGRCDDLAEQAPLLLDGSLPPPRATALRQHAADCAACAQVLRHEATLQGWLGSLPAAPQVPLIAPALPAGRVVPLRSGRRRLRLTAGAAALAAAALVVAVTAYRGGFDRGFERGLEPVRVLHVQDVAENAPLHDDDLLALTGGLETVALRRPTGWAADDR